jgi:coenzyme F420-reducing hydrogenase gamma subunit
LINNTLGTISARADISRSKLRESTVQHSSNTRTHEVRNVVFTPLIADPREAAELEVALVTAAAVVVAEEADEAEEIRQLT